MKTLCADGFQTLDGVCCFLFNSDFEEINAGEEISIVLPSDKTFTVCPPRAGGKLNQKWWYIPVKAGDVWEMLITDN